MNRNVEPNDMRWSKLKQLVEIRFADGLRGRVELWHTRYRGSHDAYEGRAWITVDGNQIVEFASLPFHVAEIEEAVRREQIGSSKPANETREDLIYSGTFGQFEFVQAIEEFLRLSIDQALVSKMPLVRALAVLDGRTGQRRLRKLRPDAEKLDWLRLLVELRLNASKGA
ncbi:MAG: hypothetical protein AAF658_05770 [Myxococcota bacterium]